METEKKFKIFGIILTIISVIWAVIVISIGIIGHYKYSRDYESLWSLADKASTIPQKSQYIDQFVAALESCPMKGDYDAIILTTPDNSFDKNFEALKSLQSRLAEIQKLDPESFQYNTAINQITQQEMGEASAMLSVFNGVWWKTNHFFLWGWVCVIHVCLIIILFAFGIRYWNYGNWS